MVLKLRLQNGAFLGLILLDSGLRHEAYLLFIIDNNHQTCKYFRTVGSFNETIDNMLT